MRPYDVIVVGAGPSGTSAATLLAKAGRRVLLLEKEELPRYKPCGGGIPAQYLATLGFDQAKIETLVETQINEICYLHNMERPLRFSLTTSPIALTRRDRFDHFLTQQAEQAGTEIITGERITEIKPEDDHVTIGNQHHTWQGRYLIAADGANSTIATRLGLRPHRKFYTALEVEAPNQFSSVDAKTLVFDFGIARAGYAWVFPKSDFHSIGIGVFGKAHALKEKLHRFLQFYQIPPKDLRWYGHKIPAWRGREVLHRGRVILTGDAAGLADPLTAEGIRFAMTSGQLAGEAIQHALRTGAKTLAPYSETIHNVLGKEFARALWFARLLYGFPRLSYRFFLSNPLATHAFIQLFNGALTYQDIAHKFRKKILRF